MNLHLDEMPAATYARQILPLTESLWGHGRPIDTYVAQTLELAQTTYGRRHYRTLALTGDSAETLASFKRYERDARAGNERLKALGIGAVFTPLEHRGRGYATAMLGLALDQARRDGFDFAYLFTDIHPQFYKQLGFVELASRAISVRADGLRDDRIETQPLSERDWTGIRKCFDQCDAHRKFALTRSPIVWDWIRTRLRHRAEHPQGQPVNLVIRSGKSIAAYVLGQREPAHDAYVVEEFAYADDDAATLIAPLLRSAAGDLRRIVAWLPPSPARQFLPRGSVRRRQEAIWMVAPFTPGGTRFVEDAQRSSSADGIWSLDHI